MKRAAVIGWIMERAVVLTGALIGLVIISILYYLGREAQYAFDRTFSYSFRVALQPVQPSPDPDTGLIVTELEMDPNSSLFGSHPEGQDGLDEREEATRIPRNDELFGVSLVTASPLEGSPNTQDFGELFRDDLRTPRRADTGGTFTFVAFATKEFSEAEMKLRWEPDASFLPESSPYDLKLKLISAPKGLEVPQIDIDLKARPTGDIVLPAFVAKSDEARQDAYVFQIVAEPQQSQFSATLHAAAGSDWAPTLQYPRYGMMPLLLGSLLMASLALLIAIPIGIACAVFLSEYAPRRLREWMKPVVELLASIPTVVLGYFGLMIVSPYLVSTLGRGFEMSSGRSVATASIVLAFLLLPTIISLAEDALRVVPHALREGGSALGMTSNERVRRIVLPAAKSGLIAASLLTFARAVGETMILWILSGGTASMPSANPLKTLAGPSRGMPDTVAIEMGNVEFEGQHYGHLFLIGFVLFLLTLAINLIGYAYSRRAAWRP